MVLRRSVGTHSCTMKFDYACSYSGLELVGLHCDYVLVEQMAPKRRKGCSEPKPKNNRAKKRRKSLVENAIATVNAKDWRLDKSLTESMLTMFEDQISCDIHFLCGGEEEKVSAHKFILVCRSSVFFAMFEGPAGNRDDEVKIPDITPVNFKTFLRFLYSDKVDLSEEIMMNMMYIGKKYQVHSLIIECVQFMEKHLTVENACMLLEGSHTYSEPALQRTVLIFIEDNAVDVLRDASLKDLCWECIGKIFESDNLDTKEADDDAVSISTCSTCDGSRSVCPSDSEGEDTDGSGAPANVANELVDMHDPEGGGVDCEEDEEEGGVLEEFVSLETSIFEALLYWANWQCRKQKLELSGENLRKVACDLIHKVRYNHLKSEYIVGKVTETGLLTLAERCTVMEYMLCQELTKNVFWKTDPRGPHVNAEWFSRFDDESKTTSVSCDGVEAITFTCFEDMYIHGFSLYQACKKSEWYYHKSQHFSVVAKLYNECAEVLEETQLDYDDIWCSKDEITYSSGDYPELVVQRCYASKQKNILFRRKVKLEKDKTYSLVVDIHGPHTYCGRTQKSCIQAGDGVGAKYNYWGLNKRDLVEFFDYDITGYYGITNVFEGQISCVALSKFIPENTV